VGLCVTPQVYGERVSKRKLCVLTGLSARHFRSAADELNASRIVNKVVSSP